MVIIGGDYNTHVCIYIHYSIGCVGDDIMRFRKDTFRISYFFSFRADDGISLWNTYVLSIFFLLPDEGRNPWFFFFFFTIYIQRSSKMIVYVRAFKNIHLHISHYDLIFFHYSHLEATFEQRLFMNHFPYTLIAYSVSRSFSVPLLPEAERWKYVCEFVEI